VFYLPGLAPGFFLPIFAANLTGKLIYFRPKDYKNTVV